MSLFWIHSYLLDKSLFDVEFKEFYDSFEDIYPALSICFKNPFQKRIETELGIGTHEKIVSHLSGSSEFLNSRIDYENVTVNLEDYINWYWVLWKNGTDNYFSPNEYEWKFPKVSYQGFWRTRFFKCYSIEIPETNLDAVSVSISSDIFPQRIRPDYNNFLIVLHYPNQMFRPSLTKKSTFTEARDDKIGYTMEIKPENVEIFRRRKNCFNNWKDYDEHLKEHFIDNVGCRPPYQTSKKNLSICSTRQQLKNIARNLTLSEHREFPPPCKGMEKINYKYTEIVANDSTRGYEPGYFWVSLEKNELIFKVIIRDLGHLSCMLFSYTLQIVGFVSVIFLLENVFQEFTQTRAIDWQALIGNVGGYVGVCLGYTLLHVPMLLANIYSFVIKLTSVRFLH